jgi:3-oxoadipate enol-lactonase
MGGAGPRLLFIGGTGGDLRQKPSVLEGPLAKHFELLAYDQRGLGRSGKPARPYTMAEYADDAAGLLDAIGWSACSVIGVSFGGMVAQELALRHPDRVERLVLACTSSGGAGGASYPLHELADLAPEERARRTVALGDRRRDAAWQAANPEAFERIVQFALRRLTSASSGEGNAAESVAGARRQLEARRHHDTWDRLHAISAPTYLCAGRYDGIAPAENMRAMQQRIPPARLELFDDGQLFLIEDTAAFPSIQAFLHES